MCAASDLNLLKFFFVLKTSNFVIGGLRGLCVLVTLMYFNIIYLMFLLKKNLLGRSWKSVVTFFDVGE